MRRWRPAGRPEAGQAGGGLELMKDVVREVISL